MYEEEPNLSRLRQGDVLEGVYFPRYSLGNLSLLHKLESSGELSFNEKALVGAQEHHAVVLSQCCEFTESRRNAFSIGALFSLKRRVRRALRSWAFNIAELVPVSRSIHRSRGEISEEVIEELQAANSVPPEDEHYEVVNSYLFEPDGEVLEEHYLAEFTRVVSVRIEDAERLLADKVLQLDQKHRREFQLKLGAFYSRRAE